MAQADLDQLPNVTLEFAQKMLKEQGEFYRFGSSIGLNGKIIMDGLGRSILPRWNCYLVALRFEVSFRTVGPLHLVTFLRMCSIRIVGMSVRAMTTTRRRRSLGAAFMMAMVVLAGAQTDLPVQRSVRGHVLTSSFKPRATIAFDAAFRHAGSQRFPLYGVAEAEQHFFVDADRDSRIRRFYWLQFEHYLPTNDDHYNYSPARVIEIGGLSFIRDTRIYTDYAALRPSPDSDGGKGRSLLAARAFTLPTAAIRARLIHLPDSDNRAEFMIIYVEALSPLQLPPDAKNEMAVDDRFPELSALVLQHAKQGLRIGRLQ